jgi:hypothetical protein
VSVSLYVTSFLNQCTLFGFFWHQLVTSGFPWQVINDGHLDLVIGFILQLMQPRCYTSLAIRNRCYNETRTRLTVRFRSLLTASSLLAYCYDCLLLHCSVDPWFFTADLTPRLWSDLLGSSPHLWSACSEVGSWRTDYETHCRRVNFPLLFKLLSREIPSRWLAMHAVIQKINIRSDSTIPAFTQHATI